MRIRKRNVKGFHERCDLLGICFLKKEYNIIFCKELQCPRSHYPPSLTIPHPTPPLRLFIRVFAMFYCNQTIIFVGVFYIVNGLIKRVMS